MKTHAGDEVITFISSNLGGLSPLEYLHSVGPPRASKVTVSLVSSLNANLTLQWMIRVRKKTRTHSISGNSNQNKKNLLESSYNLLPLKE